MTISIRPESSADAAAVRALTARAFAGAEHSAPPVEADDVPGEATLVGWLRDSPSYDERFALVATDGDDIVGHVIATWGDIDGRPVLGLGPISVDPDRQGEGIGAALMRETLARAEAAGERVMVLLGDPAYYARFGFVPASALGIVADPAWGDYFQACPLTGNATNYDGPRGTYTYAEPFSRLG